MLRKALPGLVLAAVLATPAAAQTVDEVIAKSFEARGGLDKLKAIQSIRMTGKMTMGPMEMPMVIETKRPASIRLDVTVQGTLAVQAYDGTTGWAISPMGTGLAERVPPEAAKQMAAQADMDGPLVDYKAKGHQVELLGKEKVEGRDAFKLKVTKKDGGVEYYFLDAQSWLPVRFEGTQTVRGTEIEGEGLIGDYKEVAGFLWPHFIQNGAKGRPEKQTITIEKIEINPAIDDARFEMPSAKPTAPPTRD
jgi:outer membrane lipoprotein-sorting protein